MQGLTQISAVIMNSSIVRQSWPRRDVFLVFGDDEALEGKSHQTVVAYQIAQHYCLFLNIGVCVC
jgi:hypothetical protein